MTISMAVVIVKHTWYRYTSKYKAQKKQILARESGSSGSRSLKEEPLNITRHCVNRSPRRSSGYPRILLALALGPC